MQAQKSLLKEEEWVWKGGGKQTYPKAALLWGERARPRPVFIIETVAVWDRESEQMITIVISLTKVIFPFKGDIKEHFFL